MDDIEFTKQYWKDQNLIKILDLEIERLRQQNAELAEALKDTVKLLEYIGEQRAANKLAALIAKATGGE